MGGGPNVIKLASKTFNILHYKYLHYPTCTKHLLTNVYETNESYIHYQHLLNHSVGV